jgi:hypothetical protein
MNNNTYTGIISTNNKVFKTNKTGKDDDSEIKDFKVEYRHNKRKLDQSLRSAIRNKQLRKDL